MDKYVFYSKGTNHDNADDIAITEANSLKEAVENAADSIKKASEEDIENTEDIEDIAGVLLSVLNMIIFR